MEKERKGDTGREEREKERKGREERGKEKERGKEMEVTGDVSVDREDPHEWSSQKVVTFVRSLGPGECFHSVGVQVLLQDTKSKQDVVLLLSKDDRSLSEAQVKTWVDN